MKSKLLVLSASLFFSLQALTAQVGAYTFSQFPGSYSSVPNPTAIGAPAQDDDVTTLSLPFTFTFNGTAFSSINVCSNGYLSFAGLGGSEYTALSDVTTSNVIAPFADDLFMGTYVIGDIATGSNSITNCTSVIGFSIGDVLIDWNNDFGSNPTITNIVGNTIVVNINSSNTTSGYDVINFSGELNESVSGTSPNRIYEIEFKKFSRFFVNDESLNYKVRLYETSNRIEFVYGNCVAGIGFSSPEVGLKGNSNADFLNRKVTDGTNTWSNSVLGTSITDACDYSSSAFPSLGLIYQFTPATCTVPVLSVAPSSTVSCAGASLTLNASGATTYSWVNGPSTAQYTIAPLSTTSYSLIGANQTCTATLVYTANIAANPTLVVNQAQATVCAGKSTTLSATGATSYTWNTTAGTANYVFNGVATTTILVVGSNGTCTASQSVVQAVNACTGISENELATGSAITAFPNPFNANLQVKNTSAAALQITLTDAIGKTIYTTTVESANTFSFDTHALNAGLYFISVKGNGLSETKRVVKN